MTNQIFKIISFLALVILILPSFMYFADKMNLDQVKNAMLAATVIWFVAASLWMWKSNSV
ncbi:MAG: hypothetical protein WC496_10040 [Phycisphaerae bacterium]